MVYSVIHKGNAQWHSCELAEFLLMQFRVLQVDGLCKLLTKRTVGRIFGNVLRRPVLCNANREFSDIIYTNQKCTKCNKTRFTLSANCCMFRHQGAILRKWNNKKVSQVQQVLLVLVALTFVTFTIKIKNNRCICVSICRSWHLTF